MYEFAFSAQVLLVGRQVEHLACIILLKESSPIFSFVRPWEDPIWPGVVTEKWTGRTKTSNSDNGSTF